MIRQLNPRRITAVTIILVSLGFLFFGGIRSHVTSAQSQVQVTSTNPPSAAQGTNRTVNGTLDSPAGWRASYAQIYFDDVESLQPTVGSQFLLGSIGTLTNASGEVITGTRSIKGSYTGTGSFTPYLRTNAAVLSFAASQTYRVTFKYKILVAPDRGFECLFISPTAAAAGNFLQSITINGHAGTTGTATLTNTLGPYTDYEARWNVIGTGAIAIDDIRIEQLPGGQTVATEDGERSAPGLSAGLRLNGSASVTTDTNQVISGAASVRLTNFGSLETDPAALPLLANTYYVVEFNYRIINRGMDPYDNIAFVSFQPAGSNNQLAVINSGRLLKNAEATGTFSTGALTGNANSYVLHIYSAQDVVISIDDIRLLRIDPVQISSQPAVWTALSSRPYPRLGNYQQNTTSNIVIGSPGEGVPFAYTAKQVEDRVAFADVVVGEVVRAQTEDSDFVRRLQRKNPNIVVLPPKISEEHGIIASQYAPTNATVDLEWLFQSGLDNSWFARDIKGNQISEKEPEFAAIKMMDISPFCPVVNGNTFISYQNDWITQKVLRSGIWDGIFLDNLFARINSHIPNAQNGALLDIDLNRNGVRDETPASVSNIYRAGATQILQSIRSTEGDLTLIMGNADTVPALAPHLNGFMFECISGAWDVPYLSSGFSEPNWRWVFDQYLAAQARTRFPHINILEGCGLHQGLTPTAQDIRDERILLATTALSDGFAEYDLFDARSAPYWFDEYSVDDSGTAKEDRRYKGYLGNALGPAVELQSPATVVWTEDFDTTFPQTIVPHNPGVFVSHAAGDVITGGGSLVLSNPNHTSVMLTDASTDANRVQLLGGHTYVVEFDWRIIETVDHRFSVDVYNQNGGAGSYVVDNSIVAGDSGKAHFPVTTPSGNGFQIAFVLYNGGKVAIDNLRVTDGGAGPWRRDFEKGIVIVNPINRPYTFTPSELTGPFNKTGIKRIRGTQDSVTNSGQPVTGSFTIPAADAIILLSDLSAPTPTPTPTPTPLVSNVQFTASGYNVGEADGFATITVTRTGDTSGTVTVDYATSDGTATQRTKYTIASGTLTFNPGDTSKAFTVLIVDEAYVEGNQTLNLTLSNPVGCTLGSPSTAMLTIVDNDSVTPTTNPLDQARFFVQQHYADFLSRYPDSGGWDYWTGQITQCGSDPTCIRGKRIDVSNAFFYELEYQQTAAYAFRLYRAAYGNNQLFPNPDATNPAVPTAQQIEAKKIPSYAVFSNDRARLIGSANLAQDQLALANLFVLRAEFLNKYPASTLDVFVDAILTTIKTDDGVDLSSQRSALIALGSRGAVLYRLANDDGSGTNGGINNRGFIDAEYNRAFVASQYFGYLRRDADIGGFLFWLGQVNNGLLRDGVKQHGMVCAFITSAEYQQRFSPVVTHANAECAQ